MGIIWWLIMSLCAKFQKDSFIRSVVFRKNVKRTFLSPKSLSNDFSKILFHGDVINNGTCFCVDFHGHRPSSFWRVESPLIIWVIASHRIESDLFTGCFSITNSNSYIFPYKHFWKHLVMNVYHICLTDPFLITDF